MLTALLKISRMPAMLLEISRMPAMLLEISRLLATSKALYTNSLFGELGARLDAPKSGHLEKGVHVKKDTFGFQSGHASCNPVRIPASKRDLLHCSRDFQRRCRRW